MSRSFPQGESAGAAAFQLPVPDAAAGNAAIGPRPHAAAHNQKYAQLINGYLARHRMKPGITGWAQVNGLRGETETVAQMKRRLEYDLFYIANWSLLLDIKVCLMTLPVVIRRTNAY